MLICFSSAEQWVGPCGIHCVKTRFFRYTAPFDCHKNGGILISKRPCHIFVSKKISTSRSAPHDDKRRFYFLRTFFYFLQIIGLQHNHLHLDTKCLYICPLRYFRFSCINYRSYLVLQKVFICVSSRVSAHRSTLSFHSFFSITQFICNWHKVSYCSTGAQSAAGKHIPSPGLYRSVTSDWTERSINVLSSMLLCPVLKWPTCFRDINVFYFPLCILFCNFSTFPEWQRKLSDSPLERRSHCGTKIEKDALLKIKNMQK